MTNIDARTGKPLKLLLGGSPCTHWSIAQKNNRETAPEGLGWELFKNYLLARDKYRPDYFLYENNKSMARAIRDQIDREFTRPYMDSEDWVLVEHTDTKELTRWVFQHWLTCETVQISRILINSARVSAQNRERYYWTNMPGVEHPDDLGILLRDVLESGEAWRDKGYTIDANYHKTLGRIGFDSQAGRRKMVAERVPSQVLNINPSGQGMNGAVIHTNGKSRCLTTNKDEGPKIIEPVCVSQRGRYEDTGRRNVKGSGPVHQHFEARPDGKTNTLTTVQKDNFVAEPVCLRYERTEEGRQLRKDYEAGNIDHGFNEHRELYPRQDSKSNTLSTVLKDNQICEPVFVGEAPGHGGSYRNGKQASRQYRVHSCDGKSVCLSGNGGGQGAKTGLYAIPVEFDGDVPISAVSRADGKTYPVYEVVGGQITIKDKTYPIRLEDGFYIIRKLTVTECKRLQTVPDDYVFPVSDTQAYKMLGNGWTVDVIAHILSCAPGIATSPLEVLSMYDGMSCGHIALDRLGANVVRYYATEIDKYAIQTTMINYPDTIQLGDAFGVRDDRWRAGKE